MAENDSTKGKDDETLGEGGMNALRAERAEKRELKKQLDELTSKFEALTKDKEKLESAQLSKEEKLQNKVNELTAERDSLVKARDLAKLRREVANREGKEVPEDLLSGEDKASLEASADRLLEYGGKANGPRKPQPNPHLGDTSEDHADADANALSVLGFGGQ